MLDIRATHYPSPLSEVEFASVPLTVHLVNVADETGLVTGKFRVYNDDTGLLIHESDIVPVTLAAGLDTNASALTDFDPPAPADDTYFVLFDGLATNPLVPDGIGIHLGAFYFDVKPVGMGPAPAAHHGTHELGGSDEIEVTGLTGDDFLKTTGDNPCTSYIDFVETAPPANPLPNTARIYTEDSKGFTLFSFRDSGGMVRKIVRDSVIIGKNTTGSPIPSMQPVYCSGSSGNVPLIAPARANAIGTMPAIGVTLEAIADNAHGRVMQVGLIENVNTNAFNEGDAVFVDAAVAGDLTNVAPTYPNIRQEIGSVLVKGVGNGALQIIARSMLYETIIDHAGLLNLTVGDPHTQYQRESEKGTAGGYCGLPNPLDTSLPLRADGTPARPVGIYYENDFLVCPGGSYPYYNFPWSFSPRASGTQSATDGDANHPGVCTINSSTSASSGGYLALTATALLIAGAEATDIAFRPQTLAGTQIFAGFHDKTTGGGVVDGCYASMQQVGGVDGTLRGHCTSNSVTSTTATSYVLTTNTWYRLAIRVNAAASLVTFTLYSAAGATLWTDSVNSNIPTGAGRNTSHILFADNSGTTATPLTDIDYMSVVIARALVR